MNKLLVIDGNSIINRAFYGIPLLSTKQGEFTNAVYGFLNIMNKFIDEIEPTHLAIAFDLPSPTFRHKMFDEYKGTRKGAPTELIPQFKLLRGLLDLMGIATISVEGYEADDILGTMAFNFEQKGFEVYIVSGDKDTLQLATNMTTIKLPKTSKGVTTVESYDYDKVVETYGVTPKQFIDVKAIMGDTSDNIPGVKGIGEKGALKLITEYGSIENIIENIEDVKPKGVKEKFSSNIELAKLSKVLATIDCHVEFELDDELLEMTDFYNEEAKAELIRLELKRFLPKNEKKKKTEYEIIDINNFELQYNNVEQIFIYFEEIDGNAYFGLSVNNNIYIDAINTFSDFVLANKDLLEDNNIKKVFFDYKQFTKKLIIENLKIEVNNYFDTSVAMYVVNPLFKKFDIETLSNEFLSVDLPNMEQLVGKGRTKIRFDEIDNEDKCKYIADRASVLKDSYDILTTKMKEMDACSLYDDIELQLIDVLVEMEANGIKIDIDNVKEFGVELDKRLEELTAEIYTLADEEFNINSPSQLGTILFEKLGLKGGKKTKTGFSTSADILEKIKYYHPIVPLILEYRNLSKLNSTYVHGLIACVQEDSKIHSEFNQKVTATGRISSQNPNMQNIPTRSDLGRKLRLAFVPSAEDKVFIGCDYNQIELRVIAHLANDKTLLNAFNEGLDVHAITASQVFGCDVSEVTQEQRSRAKVVNFGIIYGKSAFGLSQELNIPLKEAKEYIDKYFENFSDIKRYLDDCIQFTKDYGYSTTIFNRRRDNYQVNSSNFIERGIGERIAMNTPIQGSAADIMKIAMINVYKRLKKENLNAKLILQVHDELILECDKAEVEKVESLLKEEMENAADLDVKLAVSTSIGNSWYELK